MLSNDSNMPDDYISDGCGSGKSEKLIPDNILGVSILESCRRHDYAYVVGKTIQDKESADREFLNNMLRTINNYKKWWYPTRLAKGIAYFYYKSVDIFGGLDFWDKGK